MEPYLFSGVVLPERAQITISTSLLRFSDAASGAGGSVKMSVLLNQVLVWVDSDHEWNIFDLRNIVKKFVQTKLDMVGYLKGYVYDFEVTRVVNQSREIDYVFGVDIPCLVERNQAVDLTEVLARLLEKTTGSHGVFLRRCFSDLASAMRHADDTGFYCYRAVESLRHHCASRYELAGADKAKQWEKFREVAGCTEDALREIKAAADPLRHGQPVQITSEGRANLFFTTWGIVDAYLDVV